MSEQRGRGHGRGGARSGSPFGRAILQLVVDEIASRLQRIGVVGGTAIDAGHLVGATPPGVAKIQIRLNGADLCPVSIIEFHGPSWAIVCDPATDRAIVALQSGGLEPRTIVNRAGDDVTDRASSPDAVLSTRPV